MKKVLHILNSSSYSGAENVVINIIKNMEKYKYKFDFCYTSKTGVIEKRLKNEQIEYYLIDSLSIHNIKKAVSYYKPDIIHAHDFTASIMSSIAIKNIPIISHLHNNPPWIKEYCIKSLAYKFTIKKYEKILTVSESVISEYIFKDCMKKKSVVIGNPIDTSIIKEKANIKKVDEKYDILFIGRLTEQKNPIRFINLIKKIVDDIPDIRCACIGDGNLYEECKRHIEKLNLNKNIKLYGFLENPYTYLKEAKLLCITSEWEGFGLVAIEALSLGVPVLTTGVGGLSEIVNNKCGKICNNDEEYISEIKKLLSIKGYYNDKQQAAILRAKQLDNIEKYCFDLNNIYSESR